MKKISLDMAADLTEVEAACDAIKVLLSENQLQDRQFAIELVARELLNNAILHGSRQDRNKRVTMCLGIGRRWIQLSIADQGGGFDWHKVRRKIPDASAESGRGMAIATNYGQRLRIAAGGRRVDVFFDLAQSD